MTSDFCEENDTMDVKIFKNADEIAKEVSKIVADEVNKKSDCVLGLATGATPVPTYNALVEMYKNGEVSFKNVKTYNLDEYCDLPRDNENSYYTFMHENLFDKTDFVEENTHVIDGNTADVEKTCKEFDEMIENAGGVDIQLLGIGNNAHIGFNEPAESFTDGTFKVKLTESTINANKIYFTESEMPRYALTMGIGTIMKAKKIILIATGEKKAEAIKNTVKGEVTPLVPASVLQNHPNALIIVDEAAASLL